MMEAIIIAKSASKRRRERARDRESVTGTLDFGGAALSPVQEEQHQQNPLSIPLPPSPPGTTSGDTGATGGRERRNLTDATEGNSEVRNPTTAPATAPVTAPPATVGCFTAGLSGVAFTMAPTPGVPLVAAIPEQYVQEQEQYQHVSTANVLEPANASACTAPTTATTTAPVTAPPVTEGRSSVFAEDFVTAPTPGVPSVAAIPPVQEQNAVPANASVWAFSLGSNPKTSHPKPKTPLQRKKEFKKTVGSGSVDRYNKRTSSSKKAKNISLDSRRGGGTLLKSPPPTASCLFGPGWDENREPPDDAMAL